MNQPARHPTDQARKSPADRAARIRQLAQNLGFAHVGFAQVKPSANLPRLIQWLDDGAHGEMAYMAKHPEKRADPASLLAGAKTVICVADRYPDKPAWTQTPLPVDTQLAATGKVARYAWGDDYHRNIKDRLHKLADDLREIHPGHQFVTTVDSGAILEREQASAAGLGWVGKHTLIINPATGSWMLLGEILTTLPIQTAGDTGLLIDDHCGACTRCIDACPTQCITPYRVDGAKCISYLTIEHKSLIDPSLHKAIGDRLAGCDICQEVCPHNGKQPEVAGHVTRRDEWPTDQTNPDLQNQSKSTSANTTEKPPAPRLGLERFTSRYAGAAKPYNPQAPYHPGHATRAPGPSIGLLRVLQWQPGDRQQLLERSALKRIKLNQFKRNALICATNFILENPGHEEAGQLREEIQKLANLELETDGLISQTARQCLIRLGIKPG
jgi:epoxyqueuosine reductase